MRLCAKRASAPAEMFAAYGTWHGNLVAPIIPERLPSPSPLELTPLQDPIIPHLSYQETKLKGQLKEKKSNRNDHSKTANAGPQIDTWNTKL